MQMIHKVLLLIHIWTFGLQPKLYKNKNQILQNTWLSLYCLFFIFKFSSYFLLLFASYVSIGQLSKAPIFLKDHTISKIKTTSFLGTHYVTCWHKAQSRKFRHFFLRIEPFIFQVAFGHMEPTTRDFPSPLEWLLRVRGSREKFSGKLRRAR